jgi:hypothetical protein
MPPPCCLLGWRFLAIHPGDLLTVAVKFKAAVTFLLYLSTVNLRAPGAQGNARI